MGGEGEIKQAAGKEKREAGRETKQKSVKRQNAMTTVEAAPAGKVKRGNGRGL